jgi:hypothetical protein
MKLTPFVMTFLVAAAGCSSAPSSPSGSVPLGTQFTLKPGESASIASTGLTVTFDRVESDSRCPADVVCVQAGDATVALSAGKTPVRLLSNSAPEASVDGYRLRLERVEPYVYSNRTIEPGQYRVVLRVTRS